MKFPQSISIPCDESLKTKGIKVFWFFESPCVKYGVGKINKETWQFTLSAGKRKLSYFPANNFDRFLRAASPEMKEGIEKAKKYLALLE
jgi:hypothetical protein